MLRTGSRAEREDINCQDCGCELHYFLLGAQSNEEDGYWACPRCQPGLCHMLERWPARRRRIPASPPPVGRILETAHLRGLPDASGPDLSGSEGRGARPEEARRHVAKGEARPREVFTKEEVACLVLLVLGAAAWALSRWAPLAEWLS